MRTMVLHALKAPLDLREQEALAPAPGQAIVRLRAAALNRRDDWITQGLYPGIRLPVVLGSDGAGVVSAVGEGVDPSWLDQEVVLNPGMRWGDNPRSQSADFEILGMPTNGALADEVAAPGDALYRKPSHLDWREAAAVPLAGVTAYRAVFTQGALQPGERVLVTGVGGGVATFAAQMAVAVGAELFVTSSSEVKLQRAREMGATAGVNYRQEDWAKNFLKEHGPMNLIIDSAAGEGYQHLLQVAAPGGRIVNYGATKGPPPQLDMFKLFWKQLHLIGSTMGSPQDFTGMLELIQRRQIRPVIDQVFPLEAANDALARLQDPAHLGKIVLTMA